MFIDTTRPTDEIIADYRWLTDHLRQVEGERRPWVGAYRDEVMAIRDQVLNTREYLKKHRGVDLHANRRY